MPAMPVCLNVCCLSQKAIFRRHKVQAVIQAALRDKLTGQLYDPVKGAQVDAYTNIVARTVLQSTPYPKDSSFMVSFFVSLFSHSHAEQCTFVTLATHQLQRCW